MKYRGKILTLCWNTNLTFISCLQGSVNVHRGALLLVPEWQCVSSFYFTSLIINWIETNNALMLIQTHSSLDTSPLCNFSKIWTHCLPTYHKIEAYVGEMHISPSYILSSEPNIASYYWLCFLILYSNQAIYDHVVLFSRQYFMLNRFTMLLSVCSYKKNTKRAQSFLLRKSLQSWKIATNMIRDVY